MHKISRMNVENYGWRIFLQLRSRTQTAMQASAPGSALWGRCALQRHFALCALCKGTLHCANAAKTMCIVHCNGTVYCANAANLLCAVCTAKALCTVLALQRHCTLCQPCNAQGYAVHQLRSAVHHLPKELCRFNDCCCCAPVYHDYQTTPPCDFFFKSLDIS